MLRVNTLGLTHLLEAVRLNRPCRIVHVSSDVVYAPPMDESTAEGKAVFPRSFYGATKAAAEAMGHNYAWNLGVDFLTLRFTHVFGGGTGGPARAIENLVEAAVERRPAVVDQWNLFWAGRQDFLYVKDAASALVAVSTSATSAVRAMNVSMGVGCTFEEVVGIVRAQLNTDLDVRYDIEPAAAFRGHWPIPHDTSAAQRQFGFKRRFDMAAAVRDYADTVRARAATG
jgi:UDP-glucose 4-epimerase